MSKPASFELVGNLQRINRAVDNAGGADFGSNNQCRNFCKFVCKSLSLLFDFLKLVSTLFQFLCEHFACTFRCNDRALCGDEVIATVAVLYLYYIVLIS